MKPTITALLLLIYATSFGQCPTYTTETNYDTFTYCGGDEMPPFDTFTPCGAQTYYSSVAFTAGNEPTQIVVSSQLNYTFNPFGPNIFAHMWVFDGCNGQPVWTTITGACATGQDLLISGVVPAQNYDISLNLPPGDYIALFGYIGNPSIQHQIFGCVELSIGTPYFLELSPTDKSPTNNKETPVIYPRKIMHPRHGFIVEYKEGYYIDATFRQVVVN